MISTSELYGGAVKRPGSSSRDRATPEPSQASNRRRPLSSRSRPKSSTGKPACTTGGKAKKKSVSTPRPPCVMEDWVFKGYKSSGILQANRSAPADGDDNDIENNGDVITEPLTTLRIFNGNERSVIATREVGTSLKRLDASRIAATHIPPGLLEELSVLEKLDLSENELTDVGFPELGFPAQVAKTLRELNVNRNRLTQLPKGVASLPRLARLYASHNDIGVAPEVGKLHALTVLDLEGNRLKSLDWGALGARCRGLRILQLSKNKLTEVSRAVKYLRELREIGLAHNKLQFLPSEVLLLPKLESLDVSNNEITRVPSLQVTCPSSQPIKLLNLSHNMIYRFPSLLLHIAHKIDLSYNELSEIPGNVIRSLSFQTSQTILLEENPIEDPPYDICTSGLRALINYHQNLRAKTEMYQGFKVLVLGNQGVGKTSLVHTLMDGHSRLMGADEYTVFCDIYSMDTRIQQEGINKSIRLSVWDFSGDPAYLHFLHHFIDPNALILLTFNMALYRTGDFDQTFGVWLNYLIARSNQAKLILVGTNTDKLNMTTVRKIADEVGNKVIHYIAQHKKRIRDKVDEIEALDHISSYLQEQLKLYVHTLMKVEMFIYNQKALPVSSKKCTGFDTLLSAIHEMARVEDMIPGALRPVPSLWVDVLDSVEKMGATYPVPMVTYEEFQSKLIAKHGLKQAMRDIAKFLADAGTIVWFYNRPSLDSLVFLRPKWLLDVVRNITRRDLESIDFSDVEELLSNRSIDLSRYLPLRAQLTRAGIADEELARAFWSGELPSDSPRFDTLADFFSEQLGFAYSVTKTGVMGFNYELSPGVLAAAAATSDGPQLPGDGSRIRPPSTSHGKASQAKLSRSDAASIADSDSLSLAGGLGEQRNGFSVGDGPSPFSSNCSSLLIPAFRALNSPSHLAEELESTEGFPRLGAYYLLAGYCPPGFWEALVVRAHSLDHGFRFKLHWRDGFLAEKEEKQMKLLVEVEEEDCGGRLVRLELRNERHECGKHMETMWGQLLPLLTDIEDLIGQYRGLRTERFVQCPFCQERRFFGEWLAPSDLQKLTHKTCSGCQESVSVDYLIQPKERKAEEIQKVFEEIYKRRRAKAESSSTAAAAAMVAATAVVTERQPGLTSSDEVSENTGAAVLETGREVVFGPTSVIGHTEPSAVQT